MIAIWLGLGHTAAPSRAVIAFFLLIEWNVVLYWAIGDSELFGVETLFCGMITGAVAVPLLVARLFGLRLARTGGDDATQNMPAEPHPMQFSIRYLFGLMTALALILGMVQFIFTYDFVRFSLVAEARYRYTLCCTRL